MEQEKQRGITITEVKKSGLGCVILHNWIYPILITIIIMAILVILKEILPKTIFFTGYTIGFLSGITYIKTRDFYAI